MLGLWRSLFVSRVRTLPAAGVGPRPTAGGSAAGASMSERIRELEELVAEQGASVREANRSLAAMGERVARSHAETAGRLNRALAARSGEAGAHSERMGAICAALAGRLGLDDGRCALVGTAGALHDIGKLGIPDAILDKPGPLTSAERAVVQTHVEIGHRMLDGSGEPLLELAAVMALTHHERVDGRGYPHGVRGAQIPLEGRIAAVADVFDALTNERVFRPAYGIDAAMGAIDAGSGAQFDEVVVRALRDELDAGLRPGVGPGAGPSRIEAARSGAR